MHQSLPREVYAWENTNLLPCALKSLNAPKYSSSTRYLESLNSNFSQKSFSFIQARLSNTKNISILVREKCSGYLRALLHGWIKLDLGNQEPISGFLLEVQCFSSYHNGNTNPAMCFIMVHQKKGRKKGGQTLIIFFLLTKKLVYFIFFFIFTNH